MSLPGSMGLRGVYGLGDFPITPQKNYDLFVHF